MCDAASGICQFNARQAIKRGKKITDPKYSSVGKCDEFSIFKAQNESNRFFLPRISSLHLLEIVMRVRPSNLDVLLGLT